MATQPVCPKCGGLGFIIVEGASLSGAKPCDCRSQHRAERLEERAQIPPLYRQASFENFSVRPENPIARQELTTVLLAVKNYVRDFPNESRPIQRIERRRNRSRVISIGPEVQVVEPVERASDADLGPIGEAVAASEFGDRPARPGRRKAARIAWFHVHNRFMLSSPRRESAGGKAGLTTNSLTG